MIFLLLGTILVLFSSNSHAESVENASGIYNASVTWCADTIKITGSVMVNGTIDEDAVTSLSLTITGDTSVSVVVSAVSSGGSTFGYTTVGSSQWLTIAPTVMPGCKSLLGRLGR